MKVAQTGFRCVPTRWPSRQIERRSCTQRVLETVLLACCCQQLSAARPFALIRLRCRWQQGLKRVKLLWDCL
jgi:hypothetical protein